MARTDTAAFEAIGQMIELGARRQDGSTDEQQAKAVEAMKAIRSAFEAADEATRGNFTVDAVHFTEVDADGDGYDSQVTRYLTSGPTRADIRKAVETAFEPFSCGPHAYDCCGRAFRSYRPHTVWLTRVDEARQVAVVTDTMQRDV